MSKSGAQSSGKNGSSASFTVDVTPEDALAFAKISGDWNPLHTDANHAARTAYRRPVLHGAFSAGLLSRMAGMHLPGTDCLLHGIRLRFVRPVIPPVSLIVEGRVVADSGSIGRVELTVSDVSTGARYVDGGYEFSRHEVESETARRDAPKHSGTVGAESIVVTGATGGLGRAVVARLGAKSIGTSRTEQPDLLHVPDIERIADAVGDRRISAIVHCAWPSPDNQALTQLANIEGAVEHNLAAPLRQVISLAQLLKSRGTGNAALVLVGSTAADPGRHLYRMPLYTLSKSLIPTLSRILAVELAGTKQRCLAVTFDVVEGGMNKKLTPAIRAMHADRAPSGTLPSVDEAAGQIAWVLDNRSVLVSGATIDLSGSAIP
ncbi:MAG TPA: SDR family oxidoreductase [Gemmatimonadaceae bacterium]|nr:SDR family oxidoreductase [Gemmatimonadaceae bacterium]